MTYYELFTKAENLLIHNKITFAEYDEMVQQLNEEVRKEGEWLDAGWDGEKCSRCGWSIDDTFYSSQFLYCPNCGARMKGEANDHI